MCCPKELLEAAAKGNVAEAARLVNLGVDVNFARRSVDKKEGWTALHVAAGGGHALLTSKLLALGANIESVDAKGFSPLLLAARDGQYGVAKVLIAAGASLSAATNEGKTVMQLALEPDGAPHEKTAKHAATKEELADRVAELAVVAFPYLADAPQQVQLLAAGFVTSPPDEVREAVVEWLAAGAMHYAASVGSAKAAILAMASHCYTFSHQHGRAGWQLLADGFRRHAQDELCAVPERLNILVDQLQIDNPLVPPSLRGDLNRGRSKSPLATDNLRENTDEVLRPPRRSEHPISVLSGWQPATFYSC